MRRRGLARSHRRPNEKTLYLALPPLGIPLPPLLETWFTDNIFRITLCLKKKYVLYTKPIPLISIVCTLNRFGGRFRPSNINFKIPMI